MRITEMYKFKDGKDTFRIQIPITRPGKDININKISFDLESYVATMQSDKMKYNLKNKMLPLVDEAPSEFTDIPAKNIIGYVIEWNPEFIIAEISVNNYNKYIAPYNDSVDMKAGVVALGEFKEGSTKIFEIKKMYAYQLLYGIAAKTLEEFIVEDKKDEADDKVLNEEDLKEEKSEE